MQKLVVLYMFLEIRSVVLCRSLLEELNQVVNLFYSLAASVTLAAAATSNPVVERVLRIFTNHALHLLQQVNYAITHPNHLRVCINL